MIYGTSAIFNFLGVSLLQRVSTYTPDTGFVECLFVDQQNKRIVYLNSMVWRERKKKRRKQAKPHKDREKGVEVGEKRRWLETEQKREGEGLWEVLCYGNVCAPTVLH